MGYKNRKPYTVHLKVKCFTDKRKVLNLIDLSTPLQSLHSVRRVLLGF